MKPLYTAKATTIGGRAGHVKSSDGVLDFDLRPPKEMGGPEKGGYTNPEQLFAAGYSACFGGALGKISLEQGIRSKASITAEVTINATDDGGFQLSVVMDVDMPEVEQAKAEELAGKAHRYCPYSKAIKGNVDVKLNVTGKK